MSKKSRTPKFPDSYLGKEAEDYDSSNWMERNQKKTALSCVQYLFDEKFKNFGGKDVQRNFPYLILDLGCGTGFSSEVLIENGFRVIGVDMLIDMLSKAIQKKKDFSSSSIFELILADINYLPFRINSIDHIVSISAYNFILHEKRELREKRKTLSNTARNLSEILKKNGRIIIEFYPESDRELDLFTQSFKYNEFNGFCVKNNPDQKSGQTFLLLEKER